MKIGIVDYGMGNIHSLKSAIFKINPQIEIILSNKCEELANCKAILLPGVGNFGVAMERLKSNNLISCIRNLVFEGNMPILGICLGMQLLFDESEESNGIKGLGFLKGKVVKIHQSKFKIPHIGFNSVKIDSRSKMFFGMKNMDFYFIHSFCITNILNENVIVSTCDYNNKFIASVEFGRIWGTQFHPEKSQLAGLKIIENFIQNYVC